MFVAPQAWMESLPLVAGHLRSPFPSFPIPIARTFEGETSLILKLSVSLLDQDPKTAAKAVG